MSSPTERSRWRETQDPSGRTYYYNIDDNRTSWVPPESSTRAQEVRVGTGRSAADEQGATSRAARSVSSQRQAMNSAGPRGLPDVSTQVQQNIEYSSSPPDGRSYSLSPPRSNPPPSSQGLIQDFDVANLVTSLPNVAHNASGTRHAQGSSGIAIRSSETPISHQLAIPGSSRPAVATSSVQRQKHIIGNPNDRAGASERLDPQYKVRKDPAKFFRLGKVFLTLHAESTTNPADGRSEITTGYLGENIYSEICRFVVIRESRGSCAALRVLTYGGRGCGKRGVHKADHARIYTSDVAPPFLEGELELKRGELPMLQPAYRVSPLVPGEKLDPRSRINLGKVYTVEHNVKVRGFGTVDNFEHLYYQHKVVWDRGPRQPLLETHREDPGESMSALPSLPYNVTPHGRESRTGSLQSQASLAQTRQNPIYPQQIQQMQQQNPQMQHLQQQYSQMQQQQQQQHQQQRQAYLAGRQQTLSQHYSQVPQGVPQRQPQQSSLPSQRYAQQPAQRQTSQQHTDSSDEDNDDEESSEEGSSEEEDENA